MKIEVKITDDQLKEALKDRSVAQLEYIIGRRIERSVNQCDINEELYSMTKMAKLVGLKKSRFYAAIYKGQIDEPTIYNKKVKCYKVSEVDKIKKQIENIGAIPESYKALKEKGFLSGLDMLHRLGINRGSWTFWRKRGLPAPSYKFGTRSYYCNSDETVLREFIEKNRKRD